MGRIGGTGHTSASSPHTARRREFNAPTASPRYASGAAPYGAAPNELRSDYFVRFAR